METVAPIKVAKRKVTETVKKEVEVKIPSYWTDNVCHVFKVISEDLAVKVYDSEYGKNCSIDVISFDTVFNSGDVEEIDYAVFDEKIESVKNKILALCESAE